MTKAPRALRDLHQRHIEHHALQRDHGVEAVSGMKRLLAAIRRWLIRRLVGDGSVMVNVDVYGAYRFKGRFLLNDNCVAYPEYYCSPTQRPREQSPAPESTSEPVHMPSS